MKQNFVLIDSENFPESLLENVLEDLTTTLHPQLPIKIIAVADWKLKGKKAELNLQSLARKFSHRIDYFKIHDEPSNGKGSNSSDFAITILSLDILHLIGTDNIESISIVSSDNDFIPLVKRLSQSRIKVVGFFEKEKARNEYASLFNYSFEYSQVANKTHLTINDKAGSVEASLKAIEQMHKISSIDSSLIEKNLVPTPIKTTNTPLPEEIIFKDRDRKIIPLEKRKGVNFYLEDYGNKKKFYKHPLFSSKTFKEVFRTLNDHGFKLKNKFDQMQDIKGIRGKVENQHIYMSSSDVWAIILEKLACEGKKEEFKEEFKRKLLSAYPSAKNITFDLISRFISSHPENFKIRSYNNMLKNGDKIFVFISPFQFENLYQQG